MKKFIHKLRNKKEEERRHILHLATFIVAIIAIMFWVYSLGRNLTNEETKDAIKDDFSSFQNLTEDLSNTEYDYNNLENLNTENLQQENLNINNINNNIIEDTSLEKVDLNNEEINIEI